MLVLPSRRLVRPAADDDFVICRNAPYGQVLVLPSRCLVRPAADDDLVICLNAPYGQVLVLPSRRLVCPVADDNFGVWKKEHMYLQPIYLATRIY